MEATKISIKCSNCGTKYSIPENYAQRKFQCRRCGKFLFLDPRARRRTAPRPVVTNPPPESAEPGAPRSKRFPIVPIVTILVSLVAIVLLLRIFVLK